MKKKFLALCMAMCMVIISIFPSAGSAVYAAADVQTETVTEDAVTSGTEDTYAGYVYYTVERSTLGQGFIIEPVKVGYYETDTLADINERVLGDMSTYEGSISDYYLEAIIDGGEPEGWSTADIPQKIVDAVTSAGGQISGRDKSDRLAAFDYYNMSGWMFGINGTGLSAGAGSYVPENSDNAGDYTFADGDVVRLQYSIYGWGADLNTCNPSWGTDPLIDFPDKDYLIKAAADYTGSDTETYEEVIEVLEDWDATSAEIAEAYMDLTGETATPGDAEDLPEEPEKEPVDVTITMNAISTTMILTDEEGNLVDLPEPSSKKYTLSLTPGEYTVTGIDTDGVTSNGTIKITVTEDETQSFSIFTGSLYCSKSDWIKGTDYEFADFFLQSKQTVEREITFGTRGAYPARTTFLALSGDSYSVTFKPIGDKADSYAPVEKAGTITYNVTASITPAAYGDLTVTIPYADADEDGDNDYILEVGTLSTYYIYKYIEPAAEAVIDAEAETETYTYKGAQSSTYFYRVTNPLNDDAVTYGSYIKLTAATDVAVTKADMYSGEDVATDYNKNTVIDDLSVNVYDVADIFLNANETGSINLNVGDSYNLYPLRNWLAIEGISNSQVIEPDFHYTVIDANGNISDSVVTVEENLTNTTSKHRAEITATGEGTAIILVTYDAMTNAVGYANTASTDKTFFSAIWPENTGVIVVNVGAGEGSFNTGMTINEGKNTSTSKMSVDAIDAESDVIYYLGDEGAEYTFTPDEGVKAELLVPELLSNTVTYNGWSSDGVTYNDDGSITLAGMTEGPNIVKLTLGNDTRYQVIRTKKLDYSISVKDADGNEAAQDRIMPGDTVTLIMDTLYHPANKMSGYYNFSAKMQYSNPEGTAVTGQANQYAFAYTAGCQTMTFVIPENYTESTYNLTGGVLIASGFGSQVGSHRSVTYENGKPADFTAVSVTAYLGELPDISIPIYYSNDISDNYADILDTAIEKLHETVTEPVSASTGGEWAVLSLARYGFVDEDWYHTYYENIVKLLEANGSATLSNTKSTENSRVIIGLTAIGADPENIGGYNLLEPLTSMNYVTKQGLNGAIFALIALDSGNYTLPEAEVADDDTLTTRDALVTYILGRALENGGWTLTGDAADADITSMAIQALAPYYESNEDVKTQIDLAIEVLSDMQLSDGSFLYKQGDEVISESNSESTAQVVLALCSIGINPETDSRFIKRGSSAVDALLSFYDEESKSFCHVSEPDGMATEQALYALAAYDRLIKGRNNLYNMSDAEDIYTADIKAENVTLGVSSMSYTGSALKPGVTVTCNGRTLTEGTDYTVTYSDNINLGTAYVTVTGIGAHKGTVTKSFTIGLATPALGFASNLTNGSKISWFPVAGADGYYIYRKTEGGGYSYLARVTGASSWYYEDKTAQQGVIYTYTVRAYKGTTLSWFESEGRTVKRLAEPVLTVANAASGITVNWNSITGASGYLVYRKQANATSWTRIATIAGNTKTTYTDTNVSNGVQYVYTVRAYYGSYTSSYYSGRIIYRLSQQSIRAISNSAARTISVTWTKYLSASYYQVQYSLYSNMSGAKTVNVSPNSTITKTISGLTLNKTYYVRVRCVRSTGGVTSVGEWSPIKYIKITK